MKALRDTLIVVVLGGAVICVAIYAFSSVDESYINQSPVVREAEIACIEDGMICHAGYDSFPSIQAAQDYLDGDTHKQAAKMRELKAAQDAAASKAASAAIKNAKHRNKPDRIRKID